MAVNTKSRTRKRIYLMPRAAFGKDDIVEDGKAKMEPQRNHKTQIV